jgi:2-amino-4-hydroxy-6-hydroxymethyldihydropteridine diphosphokinase
VTRAYVAAGSNIEPEAHLACAAAGLERAFGALDISPWYRNTAAGFVGPDFINFVVGFDTALPIRAVVTELRAIETACGRPRDAPKWQSRAIDLDILLYGDDLRDEPDLKLPRPDLLKRAYMLGPLADLAPELIHPTAQLSVAELWKRFDRAAHPLTVTPPAFTSRRSGRHPPPEPAR